MVEIFRTEQIENASLPFGRGTLQVRRVVEVSGDVDMGEGRHLVYDSETDELKNNFVITFIDSVGHPYYLGDSSTFISVFGMLKGRAEAISNYLINQVKHEIPLVPVLVPDDDAYAHFVIFSNLLDAMEDAYGKDSKEYQDMFNNEAVELMAHDVYARNLLAKVAQMIEKGFNEAHYETAADKIVDIIKNARYLTSSGEISGLNWTAVDNMWKLVQDKLRIQTDGSLDLPVC